VAVAGELDIFSAPKLTEALSVVDLPVDLRNGSRTLLDLSRVTFIDSSGLACLIAADQDAKADGRRVHLRGVRGQVQMLLNLSGLTDRFTLED
jgi:anti-anti-sigma factor